jgi:glutathione S-transferase
MFSKRMHCIPQAADDLKVIAREKLGWLDGQIAGKTFICGERVTLADILLFPFLEFAATVRQPLDPANANLTAWYGRMAERPSAKA